MTTPQKPGACTTAIVGNVGRDPLPFREAFRFRETVPVGLPRTPRPPGRGFSCVPCRSVVAVPSRDVLRVYGATRKCPRRPATNMEVGRFPGPQGSGTSGKPQWLPTGASGQESKPGSRAEYQGWFKARGIRGLTPACWRFFVCGAGTAAERAVLSRDVAARHRSGRLCDHAISIRLGCTGSVRRGSAGRFDQPAYRREEPVSLEAAMRGLAPSRCGGSRKAEARLAAGFLRT